MSRFIKTPEEIKDRWHEYMRGRLFCCRYCGSFTENPECLCCACEEIYGENNKQTPPEV